MRILSCALAALSLLTTAAAHAEERIGEVSSAFRWVGPNDKIVVTVFDDPKVQGVSCYVSQAQTGGVSGAFGLAEDPSRASIACRKVAPITLGKDLKRGPEGEVVFTEKLSPLFKQLRVTRFLDEKRQVLTYLIWSTKLIDGSPMNSITAVPLRD